MSRLLAVLAASALAAAPKGGAPMEWKGSFCPVEKASHRVVETSAAWEALWKELGKPSPAADLKKHFAVAVFLGSRPTGGYSAVFEEAADEKGQTVVRYSVRGPQGMAIQAFTQPYAVRLYPRTGKPARAEARAS